MAQDVVGLVQTYCGLFGHFFDFKKLTTCTYFYHFETMSLTTVGYLLGVFLRLWIPFLVRISTSA